MFLASKLYGQVQKVPEDFGYRHLAFKYQNDPVDVIIISLKGEERLPKPLFFFCQGSLPQPVIKYDEQGMLGVVPFDERDLVKHYHIVIVGKPFIPVISHISKLGKDHMYLKDYEKQVAPKGYTDRNYLEYYVFRNNFVVKQLYKERWVKASGLVVAGHSEGSNVAVKMASINKKVSKLIYASGNPYGRIATILAQRGAEETLEYWRHAVKHRNDASCFGDDSPKTAFSFSVPQKGNLLKLEIPVLICYGSADIAAPYLDLLHVESITEGNEFISFCRYKDADHNFMGQNRTESHWNAVVRDWLRFLTD